jgi:Flp pilus assembly protein TadG
MTRLRPLRRFGADRGGATAVELAFALPVLLSMILGGIWAAMLGLSITSLHYSVEQAARCAAVNAQLCGDPGAVATFAQSRYAGPNIAPAFSYSTGGCGHVVTGQATFDLNIVPGVPNVPLSATACYP